MKPRHHRLCRAAATAALGLALGSAAQAASFFTVDTTGAQSVNLFGEAGNTVLLVDVGAFSALTSLAWAVEIEAFEPSARSEMQVSFGGSSALDVLTFTPAVDAGSGIGRHEGAFDLAPLGLAVGADGLLRIEFSEGYKDFAVGTTEGRWLSGTLTFGVSPVPEPAGAALLLAGLAVLGAVRRHAHRGA